MVTLANRLFHPLYLTTADLGLFYKSKIHIELNILYSYSVVFIAFLFSLKKNQKKTPNKTTTKTLQQNMYTGWNSSVIVVPDKCVHIELKLISAQLLMLEWYVMLVDNNIYVWMES